tara:strand:+ start:1696 stop:2172 length:477 start_codon:yes stop_codon:yes gene_type:complete
MSKKDNLTAQINKDSQSEPMLCTLVSCENPLTGQQRKYCSEPCRLKAMSIKACKERKGVYASLDCAGGPRGLSTVESSIKRDETLVTGDGRFTLDDIPIDNDVWEAVELHDELHKLDCIEHENRRIVAGFEEFVKSYNEHHEVSYATMKTRKQREQNG